MMESALIFATIVQLLGVWRAERKASGESQKLDTADLLNWLKLHNFDEVAKTIEQNSAILDDLRNDTGAINSKLDHIIGILSGGDVNIDISSDMIDFMNWMKPEKTTVSINGSLAQAMVKLIDERFYGLTIYRSIGRKRLVALKSEGQVTLDVDNDDWPMMQSDLEKLANVGIFDSDYEMDNVRYMVTRDLENIVEEKIREHVKVLDSSIDDPLESS